MVALGPTLHLLSTLVPWYLRYTCKYNTLHNKLHLLFTLISLSPPCYLSFSSFLTPDRLEKLNTIGFVWSVRGEPSVSTTLSEKVDSTAAADVDEEKIVDERAAAAAGTII